jgi:hypothetical protein
MKESSHLFLLSLLLISKYLLLFIVIAHFNVTYALQILVHNYLFFIMINHNFIISLFNFINLNYLFIIPKQFYLNFEIIIKLRIFLFNYQPHCLFD